MIGIVCAFFHTEGKGFYSKRPQSVAGSWREPLPLCVNGGRKLKYGGNGRK